MLNPNSCYQSQNYKIWKQFTTQMESIGYAVELLSITKLQNLKAIHNLLPKGAMQLLVVINHKTTKFESNSQRKNARRKILCSCYQSQNYKIWKQFTTRAEILWAQQRLLSITKLQNLKAIHNQYRCILEYHHVVINHKTTKFESNSQPSYKGRAWTEGCYQSQNYKIWKQFTTELVKTIKNWKLLSITKLQNLKAIHNYKRLLFDKTKVVINHKTTKFESNSQHNHSKPSMRTCCYQSQNYKIWKQFTTSSSP